MGHSAAQVVPENRTHFARVSLRLEDHSASHVRLARGGGWGM